MKAVVIHEAGGPEVLKLEQRPIPVPRPGQALNQVKAFGLNRSEMFTRQDHSPVKFPRILGNEAVGMIEDCPGGEFEKGTIVATAVGELGREFDGGYAEYTCPPARQCMTIKTQLDWEDFGAMPEKIPTAYGSFYKSLKLKKGETLLVRGGSEKMLRENGAEGFVVDDGAIASKVKAIPGGDVDKLLELIETTTLKNSVQCVKEGGVVSMTGVVGNSWAINDFKPMEAIPAASHLTSYASGPVEFQDTPLEELAQQVKTGKLRIPIGKVFKIDDIVEAHRTMDSHKAGG